MFKWPWSKKEAKTSIPEASIEPITRSIDIKEVKETVKIDNEQYGKLHSKLDKILTNMDSHDAKMTMKLDSISPNIISEIAKVQEMLKNVKTETPIEKQKIEQKLSIVKKTALKELVFDYIEKSVLAGKTPYFHELETAFNGVSSRRTLFRVIDKLKKEGKITTGGTGRYVFYKPIGMLTESEKKEIEYLDKVLDTQ
jgi:hypothetical protein